MNLPMPWFIPIGLGVGLAGTRTAILFRRIWGEGRRIEIIALVLMAWVPILIWLIAGFAGIAE